MNDLHLLSLRAMFMTYSRANVQGQWSVGSEDRGETNGRSVNTGAAPCATRRPLLSKGTDNDLSLLWSEGRNVRIRNVSASCISVVIQKWIIQAFKESGIGPTVPYKHNAFEASQPQKLKLPSLEVPPTTFRPLTFNLRHDTHAKGQVQRSLNSKDSMETDGWRDRQMEPITLPC